MFVCDTFTATALNLNVLAERNSNSLLPFFTGHMKHFTHFVGTMSCCNASDVRKMVGEISNLV